MPDKAPFEFSYDAQGNSVVDKDTEDDDDNAPSFYHNLLDPIVGHKMARIRVVPNPYSCIFCLPHTNPPTPPPVFLRLA